MWGMGISESHKYHIWSVILYHYTAGWCSIQHSILFIKGLWTFVIVPVVRIFVGSRGFRSRFLRINDGNDLPWLHFFFLYVLSTMSFDEFHNIIVNELLALYLLLSGDGQTLKQQWDCRAVHSHTSIQDPLHSTGNIQVLDFISCRRSNDIQHTNKRANCFHMWWVHIHNHM